MESMGTAARIWIVYFLGQAVKVHLRGQKQEEVNRGIP